MGITDFLPLDYESVIATGRNVLEALGRFQKTGKEEAAEALDQVITIKEVVEMVPTTGRIYVRLAGASGAIAVMMGAYGAHVFRRSTKSPDLKLAFDTGNRYHLLHSAALLAVPLCNRPHLVGPLFTLGILMFCGSCYYHALTEDDSVRRITPYGGIMLITGWLAILL